MAFSLQFDPFLPWWMLGLLAVIIFVLLGVMMMASQRAPWFRLLLGSVLLLAIANPVLLQEDRDPVQTVVTLLVDETSSQILGNRAAQTIAASEALEERLNATGLFDVRRVPITSRDAKGRDQTAVAKALGNTIQDVPPSRFGGAVLITDGQVHDGTGLKEVLKDAPLHSLITGEASEVDQRVRFINPQPFGIVGQPTDLTVQVDMDGRCCTG